MNTIYIDHNILVNEGNWDILRQLSTSDKYKFVLSDWNLLEIAQAQDHSQALRRMDLVLALNPWWFYSRSRIQKRELLNFFARRFNYRTLDIIFPYTESLSAMLSDQLSFDVPYTFTAKHLVSEWIDNPTHLDGIKRSKQEAFQKHSRLWDTTHEARKQKREIIFKNYISLFLDNGGSFPEKIPRFFDPLEYCWQNREELFEECKMLAIEEELYNIRLKSSRAPVLSDVVDFEHAFLGLAYCDHFISNDGFLFNCAEYTARRTKCASISRKLDDLLQ